MRNEPKTITCSRWTKRNRIDASKLDDQALVARVLENDERAWGELLRRFGPDIRRKLSAILARYWRSLRSTDTLDEIRADFLVGLMRGNKARLRAFDPARGSLKSWLLLLAQHTASDHMRRIARRPPSDPIDDYLDDEERDAQRGANWIGRGL